MNLIMMQKVDEITMKIGKKCEWLYTCALAVCTELHLPATIASSLFISLDRAGPWVGNRAGLAPSTGRRARNGWSRTPEQFLGKPGRRGTITRAATFLRE